MASPAAAGAGAVLRAARPDLTVDQTLDLFKTTGVSVYDQDATELSFPRVQLAAALGLNDCNTNFPRVWYDNGASTHSGGAAIDAFIAADEFYLDLDVDLIGASVDVTDGPEDRWDGTVEWWLFEDNSGLPGRLVASGTGVNIEVQILRDGTFSRDLTVDFDFGEVIFIPANTLFWLALHMQDDYNRMSVRWDHQGSTRRHPARGGGELINGVPNFVDGPFANPVRFDLAFRVRGRHR